MDTDNRMSNLTHVCGVNACVETTWTKSQVMEVVHRHNAMAMITISLCRECYTVNMCTAESTSTQFRKMRDSQRDERRSRKPCHIQCLLAECSSVAPWCQSAARTTEKGDEVDEKKDQNEVLEETWVRRRIAGKSAPVNKAPQFQFIGKVGEFPFVARCREVVGAGAAGETDRMNGLSEVVDAGAAGETDRMNGCVGVRWCFWRD